MAKKYAKKFTGLARKMVGKSRTYVRHVDEPGHLDRTYKNPNDFEEYSGNLYGLCKLPDGSPLINIQILSLLSKSLFWAQIIPLYRVYDVKDENLRVAIMYANVKDRLGLFRNNVADLLGYTPEKTILGRIMERIPDKYTINHGEKSRREITKDLIAIERKIYDHFERNAVLYWRK